MLDVLWDYDGTLMDTYPAMTACLKNVMEGYGCPVEEGELLSRLKESLAYALTFCAALSGRTEAELHAAFRSCEAEIFLQVPPVRGIPEIMACLAAHGARQYLVTHRDTFALRGLEAHGLLQYLTGWVTSEDGFPRKPDPAGILALMARYGIAEHTACMVGDRPLDAQAGLNAGIAGLLLDTEDRFAHAACTCRFLSVQALADELRSRLCRTGKSYEQKKQ